MSRCNDTCNGPYVGEECSEDALQIMTRDRDYWKQQAMKLADILVAIKLELEKL